MELFTQWDYLVVTSVLLISVGIGVYYALVGGTQTKDAYLLADSKMQSWPVSLSLMATNFSATSLLGYPQESYLFGMGQICEVISFLIVTPLLAYLFLPVFYKMRLTSVYEYFDRRFGYTTRFFASVLFLVQTALILGIALYAPATTLVTVTGISRTSAILAIGLVVTFYSTLGGMRAVLFTDVFQALLMFAGIVSVILSSFLKGHDADEVWKTALKTDRVNWPSLSADPTLRLTLWSTSAGGLMIFLSKAGNQMQIQRLMSVKSLTGAQRALWYNLPLVILFVVLTLLDGLVIFNFYKDCDPVLEGRIQNRAQLLPLFVSETMAEYPGLAGLFVSGIFCGCLSTASSGISALSTVTVEDYIGKFCEKVLKKSTKSESSFLAKIFVMFFGIVSVLLALAYDDSATGIIESVNTIVGCSGGPVVGLFVLGLLTVRSNEIGSLIGAAIGLCVACWIAFNKEKLPSVTLPLTVERCEGYNTTQRTEILLSNEVDVFYFFKISYLWLPVLGFWLTVLTGYLFSVLLEKLNLASNGRVYLDEGRRRINFEIFSPPLAAYLKKKKANKVNECELRLTNGD